MRRTTAGDLLDVGADIVTVQKILGHSSPATTARYDRRPEETKRKAISLLHVPYQRNKIVSAEDPNHTNALSFISTLDPIAIS
jgi:hypothetical protein